MSSPTRLKFLSSRTNFCHPERSEGPWFLQPADPYPTSSLSVPKSEARSSEHQEK